MLRPVLVYDDGHHVSIQLGVECGTCAATLPPTPAQYGKLCYAAELTVPIANDAMHMDEDDHGCIRMLGCYGQEVQVVLDPSLYFTK